MQERARGSLSPCQLWWVSDFIRRRVGQKRRVFCLSVSLSCLSITLLNVGDCAPDFVMKALEYRNDFDIVEYEKVCSCAPVLNFLRLLPIGDTTKCRSPKYGKNWGFLPQEGDTINGSRLNLACKRTLWVYYTTPNFALIGKTGGHRSLKISQFAQNCGHRKPITHSDEIWHVSVDLGSALVYQI